MWRRRFCAFLLLPFFRLAAVPYNQHDTFKHWMRYNEWCVWNGKSLFAIFTLHCWWFCERRAFVTQPCHVCFNGCITLLDIFSCIFFTAGPFHFGRVRCFCWPCDHHFHRSSMLLSRYWQLKIIDPQQCKGHASTYDGTVSHLILLRRSPIA